MDEPVLVQGPAQALQGAPGRGRRRLRGHPRRDLSGVGWLVFGVDWGDPPAALLLTVTFALVATGVGVLGGSVLRNAEQATSIGPPVGIALGMLGGCTWPLAIVPEPMRVVGHLFPQGLGHGRLHHPDRPQHRPGGIVRELAVLAAFVVVLLSLATWRLRRTLVG